jgi:cytochrome bd-type quinol oxidase subunit 2
MKHVIESMRRRVQADVDRHMSAAMTIIGLIGVLFVLAMGVWLYALRTLGRHVVQPEQLQA